MKRRIRQNKQQPIRKHVAKRAKLAVVPLAENDYQPHLIRRYGLLAVLLLVIIAQFFYIFGPPRGAVLSSGADVSLIALTDETNKAREDHGVDGVRLNDKLNEAAYYKAQDMLEKQYWSHNAPDGTEPWVWLAKVDYKYTKAGENLARNFYTAEGATAAWMRSPEHRANILDPEYTEVGFAVATGELDGRSTTIVVALYGRPAGALGVLTGEPAAVVGAQSEPLGFVARLGIGFQSMTPAALGSIVILTLLMMISFAAHLYREYIPASVHHPRHRHNHGAIKMSLMFIVILGMLMLYGGGQI